MVALLPVDAASPCCRIIWDRCLNLTQDEATIGELQELVLQLLAENGWAKSYVGICVRSVWGRCHNMHDRKANHFFDGGRCCMVLCHAPSSFVKEAEKALTKNTEIARHLRNYADGGGGVSGSPGQMAWLYLLLPDWDGDCRCDNCHQWLRDRSPTPDRFWLQRPVVGGASSSSSSLGPGQADGGGAALVRHVRNEDHHLHPTAELRQRGAQQHHDLPRQGDAQQHEPLVRAPADGAPAGDGLLELLLDEPSAKRQRREDEDGTVPTELDPETSETEDAGFGEEEGAQQPTDHGLLHDGLHQRAQAAAVPAAQGAQQHEPLVARDCHQSSALFSSPLPRTLRFEQKGRHAWAELRFTCATDVRVKVQARHSSRVRIKPNDLDYSAGSEGVLTLCWLGTGSSGVNDLFKVEFRLTATRPGAGPILREIHFFDVFLER